MLQAMLHGKLGRPSDEDEAGTADSSAWDRLTSREDPLTAAIFERFAYLEPSDAWALLRSACIPPPGDDHLPAAPPPVAPDYRFWPRLASGEGSFDMRHVEPDVLIDWGPYLFVVEAKHNGNQNATQWAKEIRAVRTDAGFAERPLIFIAAGGTDLGAFGPLVAAARGELGGNRVDFFLLRWESLREAAVALRPTSTAAGTAVLDHVIAALDAWGYRRRVGFDSLPEAAQRLTLTTTPAALKNWSIT
jgi:hypothetical protein